MDRTAALNLEIEIEIRTAAELSAVSSNRAKTKFFANMSHELRTPLNAILGYGELLREDLEGEDRIEDVDRVLESARHLERMISDLLDLSRIEAGALEVTLEPVSVRAVMVEVVRLLGPERERAGTEIRLDVADVQVRTDRLRLGQIALNLLTNAQKFAPGGLIQLRAAPEGERWALEVEDDGVGIEAPDLERIFDRFAQVDESSTRTTRGAGLGLALCRDLAHRLGGELTVRSKKGEGSTFRLTLPSPCDGT